MKYYITRDAIESKEERLKSVVKLYQNDNDFG